MPDEDPVVIGSRSFLTEVLLYSALSLMPLIVVALILRCTRAKKRGRDLNPNSDQEKNSVLNKSEKPSVTNVCYAEVAFLKKTRRGENTSTHNKIVPGGPQSKVAETCVKKSEERPEIVYSLITQCKR
ncbi:uncharacterized protein LOC114669033 isoform X2 [Erpetoichthys calabaricus]|uniref:uncharacterized protein LOC114669033 isoform X2 n=1 Tax=Erpetoichthys calabaricus TaxID=27687 RepID=UPI002234D154|nr:uncharacterized protein LOC114669033 isoform X2 [Erpetoichthys calabaricus]